EICAVDAVGVGGVAARVAAAQQRLVGLEDQQRHRRVGEYLAHLCLVRAVPVHEVRLGGPSALAAVGALDQGDERADIALAGGAQPGGEILGGGVLRGGVLRGHERILPVR